MPTSYTSLLGLALPVTGELSGTWGDTVNNYITQYLDSSVAGTQIISGSQTAVTLSPTNGSSLAQVGSGLTGSSQYGIIRCSGNPAGTLTITVSYSSLTNAQFSQTYAVINATSTNQSVIVRATTSSGTSSGVTLVAGESAVIAWNGSDFVKVASSAVDGVSTIAFGTTGLTPSTATSGAVTVAGTLVAANGGTGQSTYTTGDLLYATGSTALSKLGIGTNGQILTSTGTAPQWSTLSGVAVTTFSAGTTGFTPSSATSGAVTLAGTLATTNGGTGLTSFTANGVVYASSSSALTTGSALTFDGTNLSVTSPSTSTTFTLADNGGRLVVLQNSLGAGGVAQVGTTTNHDFYVRAGVGPAGLNSLYLQAGGVTGYALSYAGASTWYVGGTRSMDLTSTGLGIGTSSPAYKLETVSPAGDYTTALFRSGDTTAANNTGGGFRNNSSATASSRFAQIWLDADGANLSGGDYFFIEKRGNSGTVDFLQYSNAAMRFGTNYTNRATIDLTLDSSGNLGLGVTPSAWNSGYKAIQNLTSSLFGTTSRDMNLGANVFVNSSGNYAYIQSSFATNYTQYNGVHSWYTAPSWNGTGSDTISFTQAMTLDASGRLLIGYTGNTDGSALQVNANSVGSTIYTAAFNNSSTSTSVYNTVRWIQGASGSAVGYVGTGGSTTGNPAFQNTFVVGTQTSNALVFNTNDTERARITSVGNFSLGTHADRGTTVGTNAIQIFNGTAPAGTLTNGVSLYSQSGDLNFMNSAGNGFKVGYRNLPPVGTQTGSYTLAAGDVGKYVQVSTGGSITIPTSTFAEGDAITLYNNTTGNITITCSAPTAYIAGTNTVKTSMTLATRGVATILFYSATACVVSGNVS